MNVSLAKQYKVTKVSSSARGYKRSRSSYHSLKLKGTRKCKIRRTPETWKLLQGGGKKSNRLPGDNTTSHEGNSTTKCWTNAATRATKVEGRGGTWRRMTIDCIRAAYTCWASCWTKLCWACPRDGNYCRLLEPRPLHSPPRKTDIGQWWATNRWQPSTDKI